MRNGHGGDMGSKARKTGRDRDDILDFSANINPMGPPDWLRDVVSASVSSLVDYPDISCDSLTDAIAKRYGCAKTEALAGNGSSELLYMLPRAMSPPRAVIPVPAYIDYEAAAEAARVEVLKIEMPERNGFAPDLDLISLSLKPNDLVFIGHPVNPSGTMASAIAIRETALKNPDAFFVIDEAFLDFVDHAESLTINRPANVAVLVSFTKIFAIPGLRLGAVIADCTVIDKLRKIQPSWSVNTIAQTVGERALADIEYVERSRMFVRELRENLNKELLSIEGLTVYSGRANYLLAKLDEKHTSAKEISENLMEEGVAIRVCDNYDGLDSRYFRVAVKADDENRRLVDAIKKTLGVKSVSTKIKKRRPAVMFQATGSNAGKSILTAAVCRIMLQDGYSVAPFKSQNMSLNSYVAHDGGEMGRAQAVQAQACRLDPDVRMNPILLKPNSETGSQVIVNGKPVGNMNVSEYIQYKPTAFAAAKEAYDSLAEEYNAIVLEGAGSPAEVNLKKHDIVNMNMARYAEAPVYIIGDIDRGGVFASFVGTFETMTEWERKRTAGFIINKFRGKESLLKDALDYTFARTGKRIVGTIPHIHQLGLPEEDSVGFKRGDMDGGAPKSDSVHVAVIDLPHISNFTDFDALRMEDDVWLRTVRGEKELGKPDVIILPGSKNVIGDIEYLKSSGIGSRIVEAAENGTQIVGICAGLQLLGTEISDPHFIESSDRRTVTALGLLPLSNTLEKEKTLRRARGRHVAFGKEVYGYEIHHGAMSAASLEPCVVKDGDGEVIGVSKGNIWGTYLHGIFDADEFRRWFIDGLRVGKGLLPLERITAVYDIEPALDRLADIVREHLRMDEMYRIMGLR